MKIFGTLEKAHLETHYTTSADGLDSGNAGLIRWNLSTRELNIWNGASWTPFEPKLNRTTSLFIRPTTGVVGVSFSSMTFDGIYLVDATRGAASISLPKLPIRNSRFVVKKIDGSANAVTVKPEDTNALIDGKANFILNNQWDSITVVNAIRPSTSIVDYYIV